MRKTYAYNSIIFGVLIGLLVYSKTNIVLGVIAGLAVSIVGFVLIKFIEDALYHASDAVGDAVSNKISEKRAEKNAQNESKEDKEA